VRDPAKFTREIVSGIKWSAAARYGDHAVGLVTTAILARLLSPDAFGLLAISALVTGFLSSIADLGTATSLIQRQKVSNSLKATVFWANLVTGALLAALAWLLSPVIAQFFGEAEVEAIVQLLSLGLVFSAVGAVPTALLSRGLAFDKLARVQIGAAAIGGGVGIGLALNGAGVWSLVTQHLVRTFVEAAGSLVVSGFRPTRRFKRSDLLSVASFGVNLSGFQITNFITRNIDNLLIGRFLGATTLGYYDIAWRLIEYPKAALAGVVGRVMVPTYARLQSDQGRLGRAYLRVMASIALVSVPVLLGLALVAKPFILLLIGEKWAPAAVLVTILAPVGLAQTMGSTSGSVYIAKNRTGWLFAWGLFAGAVTTGSVVVGLGWGAMGVAAARLVSNTILFPINVGISLHLVGHRLSHLMRMLRPIFGAGVVMAAVVLPVRLGLATLGVDSPLIHLASSTAVGCVAYLGVIWMLRPPIVFDILATLSTAGVDWVQPWMARFQALEE